MTKIPNSDTYLKLGVILQLLGEKLVVTDKNIGQCGNNHYVILHEFTDITIELDTHYKDT